MLLAIIKGLWLIFLVYPFKIVWFLFKVLVSLALLAAVTAVTVPAVLLGVIGLIGGNPALYKQACGLEGAAGRCLLTLTFGPVRSGQLASEDECRTDGFICGNFALVVVAVIVAVSTGAL